MSSEDTAPEITAPGGGFPKWSCALRLNESEKSFTVGAKNALICDGEYAEILKPEAQILFAKEELQYTLRILNVVGADHNKATFEVTGYKPGIYEAVGFQISDGGTTVEVAPLSWSVVSVIPEGQQAQPIGPIGPFRLSMPMWVWASLGAVVLIVLLLVARAVRKHLQRKRMLEELSRHSTALSPYNQFNKDMRGILRRYQTGNARESGWAERYLGEIDESFRLFLVRELLVPAQQWSIGAIGREIRRRHRAVHDELGTDLRRVLRELEKAKREPAKLSPEDCDQLAGMSRKVADQIFLLKRK